MENEIKKLAKKESTAAIAGWVLASVLLIGMLYSYQKRNKDERN